jgi:DMSO reductase anchor subunit
MSAHERFSHNLPLLVFSACAMIATGLVLGLSVSLSLGADSTGMTNNLIAALAVIATGGAASFFHLGRKERGHRAFIGLSHSWLSREAALALLFGAMLACALALRFMNLPGPAVLLTGITAGLGTVLCAAIGMLYRLHARPGWNGTAAVISPLLTAVLLAAAVGTAQLGRESIPNLFMSLWVADLVSFALRMPTDRKISAPGTAALFPSLRPALVLSIPLRLLVSLAALGLFNAGMPAAGGAAIVLAIALDRFLFYAGARQTSPAAEIAALKAERMRAALR